MRHRLELPTSAADLTERLRELHKNRRAERKARRAFQNERRRSLTKERREDALRKTNGHCHLCGGDFTAVTEGELLKEQKFVVDHIVPKAVGGDNCLDNYLPAHSLCNGCRWFYSPEEFQWILRMGVWARKKMEDATPIGKAMCDYFLQNERAVIKRRKRHQQD